MSVQLTLRPGHTGFPADARQPAGTLVGALHGPPVNRMPGFLPRVQAGARGEPRPAAAQGSWWDCPAQAALGRLGDRARAQCHGGGSGSGCWGLQGSPDLHPPPALAGPAGRPAQVQTPRRALSCCPGLMLAGRGGESWCQGNTRDLRLPGQCQRGSLPPSGPQRRLQLEKEGVGAFGQRAVGRERAGRGHSRAQSCGRASGVLSAFEPRVR